MLDKSRISWLAPWLLILLKILNKAGFDFKISLFFQDYIIGRKTKYHWNNFSFYYFNIDIGVRQSSALSSILLALYLSSIFHIFEKKIKKSKNSNFYHIFFIKNGLFVSQDKSLVVSNSYLFCSYYIMSFLLEQFGFVIEHGKIEVFHFSRLYKVFNSLLLNLTTLEGPILYPKETWCCLRFIFNRKLTFQQYINFYTYKAILTIKCKNACEFIERTYSQSKMPLIQNLYTPYYTIWFSTTVL